MGKHKLIAYFPCSAEGYRIRLLNYYCILCAVHNTALYTNNERTPNIRQQQQKKNLALNKKLGVYYRRKGVRKIFEKNYFDKKRIYYCNL